MIDAPHTSRSVERPRSVTLVAWGVFLLGMVNGWRAIAIFNQRRLLLQWEVSVDPAIASIASSFWFSLFSVATYLRLRRRPLCRWAIPVSLLLYAASGWLLSGMIQGSFDKMNSSLFASLPVASLVLFVLTILTGWVLNRKAAREYFVTRGEDLAD
jgi:hypothetical protein